ncbi:AAA family ATPase [Anaeromyxobacter oryzae]|uniref:ATPase n=1 Tax=Anaeromyxobacter oryzae TaxID=2918170 RepID=A0ABM7WVL0_9BACT|nr:ATP-binding protein [Anaeromyxobacter oryzae]BDG03541.1 ATPase [Anaeromyxobacter oryzae]
MATAEQVKALLESHAEGDDERFYAVAMQVAAYEARQGHGRIAQDLRAKIDSALAKGAARDSRPVPVAQPRGDLASLLSASYPKARLSDVILDEKTKGRLKRVVSEQRQHEKLRVHALRPRNRLLLVGPPGSGKTLTASALAGELSLPLFTILLDGLITKFMGETSAKLRLVFESIASTRGVYLFDEFDAIGGKRSSANDVGEIRRVLNSFLQFLEQEDSRSIVVAATNHPELLDPALFRRFDDVLEYTLPTLETAEAVFKAKLALFDTSPVDWDVVLRRAHGLSQAEITLACEDAAKESILRDQEQLTTEVLLSALDERHSARRS